jgi:hypothetical protein
MRGGRRGSRVRWPLLIVLLLFLSWTGGEGERILVPAAQTLLSPRK